MFHNLGNVPSLHIMASVALDILIIIAVYLLTGFITANTSIPAETVNSHGLLGILLLFGLNHRLWYVYWSNNADSYRGGIDSWSWSELDLAVREYEEGKKSQK